MSTNATEKASVTPITNDAKTPKARTRKPTAPKQPLALTPSTYPAGIADDVMLMCAGCGKEHRASAFPYTTNKADGRRASEGRRCWQQRLAWNKEHPGAKKPSPLLDEKYVAKKLEGKKDR